VQQSKLDLIVVSIAGFGFIPALLTEISVGDTLDKCCSQLHTKSEAPHRSAHADKTSKPATVGAIIVFHG
jgi:hypothetical protein